MKDIIIFINAIRPATFDALSSFEAQTGRVFYPIVLVDRWIFRSISERNGQTSLPQAVPVVVADFDSPASLRRALAPYQDRIFAVTSQYENSILELQKLIPYLPYLPMPTEQSLTWATEKIHMRQMMESHDPALVPRYAQVSSVSEAEINRIERKMDYPLIVKPSGLEGSLLVSEVANRAELISCLERTFEHMQAAYSKWIKRQEPTVVVEEFMVGQMYSVDTYVAADGTCRHTPQSRSLRVNKPASTISSAILDCPHLV